MLQTWLRPLLHHVGIRRLGQEDCGCPLDQGESLSRPDGDSPAKATANKELLCGPAGQTAQPGFHARSWTWILR
ncbi:hypothetical protein SKAU_G00047680 [Synaphobranchus kaupii]|uniref:Uncharacterized protein n=1 Tax=Synaphobranchus kaupii TaxID=118154 RepID=A0A9Q1G376_SYNKA|nr:hypothetical protein SKAU_G00047680 [Synaphobranchus kaupii]